MEFANEVLGIEDKPKVTVSVPGVPTAVIPSPDAVTKLICPCCPANKSTPLIEAVANAFKSVAVAVS